jgi:hypothetical protein
VPLVLLERSWWVGFLWNLFGKIWIQNVANIDFLKWFLPLKIQINSKKNQVLEEKIILERGNTWANGTGHTSEIYKGKE